ncbi:glycosyltransferase family 4 protein [Microbacterium sp.]|jgi:glycosyltransferase involved in cell wall biosynthesis|uniref:glycosyltransferase family 4 protein n=1 Tax=Microbacterium sp. TaxID=51671 RepID=UPI002607B925|nr:glycosyltransferase family 4 protein [Microbacterium sp.]
MAASTMFETSVVLLGPGQVFNQHGVKVERVLSNSNGKVQHHTLALRLARTIARGRPDVVIANSTRAASVLSMIPRRRGTTYICHMRDDLNPARNSRRKIKFMTDFVLRSFDGVIANSEWTLSTVPQRALRRLSSAVANPVSGARCATQVRGHGLPLIFLSLSRLDEWKGIHHLVAAGALLERDGYRGKFMIQIAGAAMHANPDFEKQLRRLARPLGTSAQFLGHVEDTARLLRSCHVLVCASVTPEPFGQVVVQGLAGGLAVIATDQGGPREVLSDRAGLLVEPNDPRALADAMARLIDHPTETQRLQERGLKRAAVYTDHETVRMMDAAINNIVRSRKSADHANRPTP